MILKSITLHPFAGIQQETVSFSDKLNVIVGRNESGKSTLFNAIAAALFIPVTARAKTKEALLLEDYYPATGSNVIRITLVFEADGDHYTLEKCWSKDPKLQQVSLRSKGRDLQGPVEVEKALAELLRFNPAAWEHILLIPQSSIRETIQQLESKRTEVFNASQLPGLVTGDIDPKLFLEKLNKEITDHYARWDRSADGPEEGRGINNRWIKGGGYVLKKWYDWEEAKEQLQQVIQLEKELDEKNTALAVQLAKKEQLERFIEAGNPLMADAMKREEKGKQLAVEEKQLDPLTAIMGEWQQLAGGIKGRKELLERDRKELEQLKQELDHAKKNTSKQTYVDQFSVLRQIKQEIEALEKKKKGSVNIGDDVLQKVKRYEEAVDTARIKIAAQKLIVELTALTPATIKADIPGEAPQSVNLKAGQQIQFKAAGSMKVEASPLHINIKSGNVNLDELEKQIQEAQQQLNLLLQTYGVSTVAELSLLKKEQHKLEEELRIAESRLSVALQKRTYEKWEQYITELNTIPATRSEDVVQLAYNTLSVSLAELERSLKADEEKITAWVNSYQSVQNLMKIVVETNTRMAQLKTEVDKLQPLPAGYPDSSTFLNEMNRKRNEWNKINNDIADINIAITKLEKDLEAVGYEATELQEIERKTRMEFARVKEKAEALEAVREAALPLLATANDPFLTLQPRIVGHVKELTADRYTEVKMKDNLPTAMVRDGMELRPRQLSGGTGGVLALALRLALADLYLEDRKGFLMMDDPFTEMDEDRHALAANALVRMGEQKQMIFFTCHKQHAKLFPGQLRIERKKKLDLT